MAALNSTLGIPEDRTYIRYTATTDWGWNGVATLVAIIPPSIVARIAPCGKPGGLV